MINYSKREVSTYCSLSNIKCEIIGNGFVYEQSIEENTILNSDDILTIKLKTKINNDEEIEEDNEKE